MSRGFFLLIIPLFVLYSSDGSNCKQQVPNQGPTFTLCPNCFFIFLESMQKSRLNIWSVFCDQYTPLFRDSLQIINFLHFNQCQEKSIVEKLGFDLAIITYSASIYLKLKLGYGQKKNILAFYVTLLQIHIFLSCHYLKIRDF